jgi:hypothetical protein
MDLERLHGGRALQRERNKMEANEKQGMAQEGPSGFIPSEWAWSRVHLVGNGWASWAVLRGGVVH